MKGIDGSSCRSKARTFDVDVALRGSTIHVDVQHSSVLIALLYDVIHQLHLPICTGRPDQKEIHNVQSNSGFQLHYIKFIQDFITLHKIYTGFITLHTIPCIALMLNWLNNIYNTPTTVL